MVAGICEFLGAVLLGANVADTIKSGIAKLPAFNGTPGMLLCCCLSPSPMQYLHGADNCCRLDDGWHDGGLVDNWTLAGSCHLSRTASVNLSLCRSVPVFPRSAEHICSAASLPLLTASTP